MISAKNLINQMSLMPWIGNKQWMQWLDQQDAKLFFGQHQSQPELISKKAADKNVGSTVPSCRFIAKQVCHEY